MGNALSSLDSNSLSWSEGDGGGELETDGLYSIQLWSNGATDCMKVSLMALQLALRLCRARTTDNAEDSISIDSSNGIVTNGITAVPCDSLNEGPDFGTDEICMKLSVRSFSYGRSN
jgi:hypothetical protein